MNAKKNVETILKSHVELEANVKINVDKNVTTSKFRQTSTEKCVRTITSLMDFIKIGINRKPVIIAVMMDG